MALCPLKTARARGYNLHSASEATSHFPTLVSSHYSFDVLMVFLYRIHRIGTVVCRHELLRSFIDVHLLCIASFKIQPTTIHFDGDYGSSTHTNDHRMRHQHLGL